MKEIENQISEIVPDITPEQLSYIMDIIWEFSNEYASYIEREAVSSAISSLERFGR